MLRCKCGVKNYLDPYPFWNFKGRTKCAGCDAVYAVEIAGGAAVGEPQADEERGGAAGPAGLRGHRRLEAPGRAREDAPGAAGAGRRVRQAEAHRPKNARGRLVSGRPLKPEDLIGSRSRYIVEGVAPK